MDKLRLRFSKEGRAVYISHLDLMRTMQRAFMRAGFRLKYSEGFNPHPVMSILLPLSVGCASGCELMDFSLTNDEDLAALPARLNGAMPEGITALEAYEGGRKVRELKWLRLSGRFDYDALQSLSTEARQKLKRIDPETLAQASRIPGVSPSDVNVLLLLAAQ